MSTARVEACQQMLLEPAFVEAAYYAIRSPSSHAHRLRVQILEPVLAHVIRQGPSGKTQLQDRDKGLRLE